MKRLQSEARKSTGPVTSSGVARRPSGVRAIRASRTCSRVSRPASVAVTRPGATQFTRMPRLPSSLARLRLKPSSADLAVA